MLYVEIWKDASVFPPDGIKIWGISKKEFHNRLCTECKRTKNPVHRLSFVYPLPHGLWFEQTLNNFYCISCLKRGNRFSRNHYKHFLVKDINKKTFYTIRMEIELKK